MKRTVLAGTAAGGVALTAMSSAWACSEKGELVLSAVSGVPGTKVDLTATGFVATSGPVVISWNLPLPLGIHLITDANETGTFTTSIVVPAGTRPGIHTIYAEQRRSDDKLDKGSINFTVLEPARSSTDPSLPVEPVTEPGSPTVEPVRDQQPVPTQVTTTNPVAAGTPAAKSVGAAPARAVAPAGEAPVAAPVPATPTAAVPVAQPAAIDPLVGVQPALAWDLWSGVERGAASGRGVGLTDTGTSRPDGASLVGVGLLAVGAAGLAASALVLVPARLRRRVARRD